jgi:hypothetical protein
VKMAASAVRSIAGSSLRWISVYYWVQNLSLMV